MGEKIAPVRAALFLLAALTMLGGLGSPSAALAQFTSTTTIRGPVPPGAPAAANPLKKPTPRAALTAAGYTYTTLYTNGFSAYPSGINNAGQVVGNYGCCGFSIGFLFSGGSYTTIDVSGVSTILMGINDAGQIVGWIDDVSLKPSHQGFLYSGGIFTPIIEPGGGDTVVYGINNAGQMIGSFYDTKSKNPAFLGTHAFLLSGGVYTTIDVPGGTLTTPSGINNAGQIVGSYSDASGNSHGFLYSGGIFTTIDDPNAVTYGTFVSGINDAGQIVGVIYDASQYAHGFLLSGGTFTTIDTPGNPVLGTQLSGINNAGQIVGVNYNYQLGFLATPSSGAATATNNGNCGCDATSSGIAEGEPINAGTGNTFLAETDFTGGAATGLSLTRTYNSADAASSAFGSKWHSTWHRGLVSAFGLVTVTRADGRADVFTQNASGAYVPNPDVTSVLTPVPATGTQTGWALTLADDSVENYTLAGLLTSVTTRAGLVTSLAYDGNNNLIKVTGPFGHKLTFTYDGSGRVQQMTGPDSKIYTYAYDSNNNLISVTYPDAAVRQICLWKHEFSEYPDRHHRRGWQPLRHMGL